MIQLISSFWWAFASRGLLAVLYGLTVVLLWPILELGLFVPYFCAYAFLEGLLAIVAVIFGAQRKGCWMVLIEGFAGVLLGIVAISHSDMANAALLGLITGWALVVGVFQIFSSIQLRKEVAGERLLGSVGVISIAFGLSVLFHLDKEISSVVWLFGIYTILRGILVIILTFKIRKIGSLPEGETSA
jgi:uncharacterized membrane protein HdeD (DUF308 family)